jgi:polysaccharide export outer membrane protein
MSLNARLKSKAVWSSFALAAAVAASSSAVNAQSAPKPSNGGTPAAPAPAAAPADYVIGPNDLLSVVFWREPEMSGQVRVRPDGRISVPLLNDVPAVGLTPDQLRRQHEQAAKKYNAEPNATVVVIEINSRSVFVVGQVVTPGVYPLNTPMNVLQAIASAGGLLEFADGKNIVVERNEGGRKERLRFSYPDVVKGKRVEENVSLKPGDTVIVP